MRILSSRSIHECNRPGGQKAFPEPNTLNLDAITMSVTGLHSFNLTHRMLIGDFIEILLTTPPN